MMYFWLVVFLLTGILIQVESQSQTCGKRGNSKHKYVIGGKDAKRGDWPWQVLLIRKGAPFCGGALINNQWVVTAAHCLYTQKKYVQEYIVGIGDHDIRVDEDSQVDVKVGRIIVHPGWDPNTLNNDIALIQLQEPVSFNRYVSPVCLASKSSPPPGTKCFITGWGKMKRTGRMVPLLQQGELPVVSSTECKAQNEKIKPITPQMICAGDAGKTKLSGCHGDSGGPFVCNVDKTWELYGAVSWGPPDCSSSNAYTVFARIYYFKEWIKNNIATFPSPPPLIHNTLCSNFTQGDGAGDDELSFARSFSTSECIDHCYKLAITTNPKINGVNVPSNGGASCYCEIGMTRIDDNPSYKTCRLNLDGVSSRHSTLPPKPVDCTDNPEMGCEFLTSFCEEEGWKTLLKEECCATCGGSN